MATPTNLFEYYQSKGQALPSVQERQAIASQAGIQNYSGRADQNQQLLSYLQSGAAQNQPSINADKVGNANPIVPPPTTTTAKDNLALRVEQNAPTTPIIAPAPVKGSKSDLQEQIRSLIEKQGTQGAATTKLMEEQGIEAKTKALNDITNEYNTTARAYENKSREILGSGAKTAEQSQADIANLNYKKNNELADIAIRKSVALGDLNTAQSLVDAKIKAEFEPLDNQIKGYEFLLQQANNDLTDSEKMKLQNQLDMKKMSYQANLELANYRAKNQIDNAAYNMDIPGYVSTAPSTYTVKGADLLMSDAGNVSDTNLQAIAKAAGISYEDLLNANPNIKSGKVKAGDTINLPTALPSAINKDKALATATQIFLGSSKFTKEQKADFINSIKNGEDPLTILKNQARDKMSNSVATDVENKQRALAKINDINTLLQQYYANGGDTGLFTGTFQNSMEKLGKVNDPTLAKIGTSLAVAMQAYRLAVTGTAASFSEDQKIQSIFPSISKGQALNDAKTQGIVDSFKTDIDQAYRNVLGKTYDDLNAIYKTQDVPEPMTALNAFANSSDVNASLLRQIHDSQPQATPLEIYQYLKNKGLI